MINLKQVKRIHFIGIGGIAMSAVAGIAICRGFIVSGSDSEDLYDPAKLILEKYNIKYNKGYDAKNITAEIDLVVLGGGESDANPELKMALDLNLKITSFPALLGQLIKEKKKIVVSGTHGKTTISSLISLLLEQAGENPGYMIGGVVRDFDTNFKYSEGKYFVIEGDEYYSSFLDREPKFMHYTPDYLIINNIELDHFDYFSSEEQLLGKFKQLVSGMRANQIIIANKDDINVLKVLQGFKRLVIWYSLVDEKADFFARFKKYNTTGQMIFSLFVKGEFVGDICFSRPGEFNIMNCLAAIALVKTIKEDLSPEKLSFALERFRGPKRRFELIAEINGITIIDDYAHHATAVKQTLKAARQIYPERRIWAIFEPHTYSRTQATLPLLKKAFNTVDEVIISDIYPAREKFLVGKITGEEVVKAIKEEKKSVHFIKTKTEVLNFLLSNLNTGDVVIIMAVGSFNQIAGELSKRLQKK